MAKATILAAWIGLGIVAHSFLAWVGSVDPVTGSLIRGGYILAVLVCAVCLLFDRSIMRAFEIPSGVYYSALTWFLATAIVGGGVVWVISKSN